MLSTKSSNSKVLSKMQLTYDEVSRSWAFPYGDQASWHKIPSPCNWELHLRLPSSSAIAPFMKPNRTHNVTNMILQKVHLTNMKRPKSVQHRNLNLDKDSRRMQLKIVYRPNVHTLQVGHPPMCADTDACMMGKIF